MYQIIVFIVLIILPDCMLSQIKTRELLPEKINGWIASDTARLYSGEEIFDYMDGAGEIYRSYNFNNLLVQRYACPSKEEILVEIFDMGSARNAYGVFTYMQGRGTGVSIGQNGEYKFGLLTFWKDKYFVCVQIEKENNEASRTVFDIGKSISNAIPAKGVIPEIIGYLTKNKIVEKSIRYFFRYEILNIHYFVADKNILNLTDSTDGVLVKLKNDKSTILLIGYPDKEQTNSAYDSFIAHYMPDGKGNGIVETENKKWTACVKEKKYLLINFDSPTKEQAVITIDTFKRRLP
jgi:hypothetical protein